MNSVRESLDYDEEKGVLVWAKSRGFIRAGKLAGGMVNGAMYVTLDGRRYLSRDLVWYLVRGQWPKARLHHKDGDRANISIDNLSYKPGNMAAAADSVDFGIRISEFGYTVLKLSGGGVEALSTEPGIDKALDVLRGAMICSP